MRLEVERLLRDMEEAAGFVAEFTRGKTWEDYQSDRLLRSGVERQFEIAGEALSQLLKIDPDIAKRITDYRKIISFRNILIHNYGKIQHSVTWQVVEKNLPVLRDELQSLLRDTEPDSEPDE